MRSPALCGSQSRRIFSSSELVIPPKSHLLFLLSLERHGQGFVMRTSKLGRASPEIRGATAAREHYHAAFRVLVKLLTRI